MFASQYSHVHDELPHGAESFFRRKALPKLIVKRAIRVFESSELRARAGPVAPLLRTLLFTLFCIHNSPYLMIDKLNVRIHALLYKYAVSQQIT